MRAELRVSRHLRIKRLCKRRAYLKRKPSVLCAYNAHGDCDCDCQNIASLCVRL